MNTFGPDEKKRIKSAIKEISDSMTRIDAEKDLIKDIVDVTSENHGLNKKYIRKMATVYHKANMDEVRTEHEELETLYEEIMK